MRARDNPFRVELVHRLAYRAPNFDWAAVLRRLESQGGRGAVRGDCGSGKSTLLRQLEPHLVALGLAVHRQRLDADDKTIARRQARRLTAAATPGTALLIDGADRLATWRWMWLRWRARRASVLVATTHAGGKLPTLHCCVTSPELLRGLVAELEPESPLADREADHLLSSHGGNLREVFRELYDRRAATGVAAVSSPGGDRTRVS